MLTENYSLENKITLYEYLRHYTKVGDRCDIQEDGWNAVSCIIDDEDLYLKYINEDLLYNTYVQSVDVETVSVTSSKGTDEEIRRTIYTYPEEDL